MPVWAGRGQPKGPRAGMTQGAVPSPPPLPFPDQQGGGCSQKDEGGWSRQKSRRQRPDDPTAAVKGWERVSYPAGLRGSLGSGSIPVWGPRDTPTKAKPAPAPVSLARPKGQKVKAERKELGKQQEPTQAELEQFAAEYVNNLVRETAQQLQAEQPDEPRVTVQSGGHEHAGCHFCSPDTRVLLGKLLQRCKKLEEQVESLAQKAGGKVENYPKWRRQSLQHDEQIKCLQASIMQLQKDYEKFSSALANLQQDRQQEQNDIKALSQALERIKKQKADKEELLVLGIDEKADKDKVSRSQFEACVEQLNKVMEEVTVQEKFLHRFQQELQRQMDCKLDRRELGAFQQQQEERWKSLSGQLQEKALKPERDSAAGIRKQLLPGFHCLSCDRPLNMLASGP
ncbi:glutamine-rich protein 2-like [Columba livia]|uniref:glutamine-rich protein 2-like n=1 Tax=Columba livia TaxID=8932 RepID=UPI0031BA2F7E